jgi:hypothetical protein
MKQSKKNKKVFPPIRNNKKRKERFVTFLFFGIDEGGKNNSINVNEKDKRQRVKQSKSDSAIRLIRSWSFPLCFTG